MRRIINDDSTFIEGLSASRRTDNPYQVNSRGWILWERGRSVRMASRYRLAERVRDLIVEFWHRITGGWR